ncbi:thioredoxin family protein [Anabaena cylindrica FACHB-243]|nr:MULTISPECIES: thioredoxin family protein [Anabaena]MBD2421252.1 thioredoxin family protein [Anabaena cylindrica FACHB-243]MBY5284133.1 thioredoxin family protein [Anabaena sp. CCAP 1446/1C]MBY5308083.1 thioredoxin family protein [Anabaena sp. CCAP 1446/1C]MCM2406583.1 thioredoxin family protein [Anabaena sp. CCAP 1446/1C]
MTYDQRQAFLTTSHVGKLFGIAHLFPVTNVNHILSVNEKTFAENVLESPIPVLVNFTAPWSGLSRIIHPMLLQFQTKYSDSIKIVEVNADQNFKLCNTYRLKSLPTLLLINNGIIRQRLEDFRSREDLNLALEEIKLIYGIHHLENIDNSRVTG